MNSKYTISKTKYTVYNYIYLPGSIMKQFRTIDHMTVSLLEFLLGEDKTSETIATFPSRSVSSGASKFETDLNEISPSSIFKRNPNVSLSTLFSIFRVRADLDKNGLYFICDLEEKITLAKSIDSMDMSFGDKYTFCMAPVNTDKKELLDWFQFLARSYSRQAEVKLTLSAKNIPIAKNPDELLHLELLHQVKFSNESIFYFYL